MTETINFLAIDLGASSSRALLGRWDGEHLNLEEFHRFPNEPVAIQGHQHWDEAYGHFKNLNRLERRIEP